jgi:hypothetical protein
MGFPSLKTKNMVCSLFHIISCVACPMRRPASKSHYIPRAATCRIPTATRPLPQESPCTLGPLNEPSSSLRAFTKKKLHPSHDIKLYPLLGGYSFWPCRGFGLLVVMPLCSHTSLFLALHRVPTTVSAPQRPSDETKEME